MKKLLTILFCLTVCGSFNLLPVNAYAKEATATQDRVLEVPFGRWQTPITAEMTMQGGLSRYSQFVVNQGDIYWLEMRKEGLAMVVQGFDGVRQDLDLQGHFPRTKVHEYGGLSFTAEGETIYFVNDEDQRLYVRSSDQGVKPLTEEGIRFADFCLSREGIIAVAEDHRGQEVVNKLVLIDRDTGTQTTLAEGKDFYSNPEISPDGKKLAWVSWNHPNMPWDSTQLWVADFEEGKLENQHCLTNEINESIFQPRWSQYGTLYFVSDRDGWWNLHRCKEGKIENIYPLKAEFALPLWLLGMSTWGFTGQGEEILCIFLQEGNWKLGIVDPDEQLMREIKLDYNDYSQVAMGNGFAVVLAASPTKHRRLLKIDLSTLDVEQLNKPKQENVGEGYLSIPQLIEYVNRQGKVVYAYYYAPVNQDYKGIDGTLPPLIIESHGGPTAMADPSLSLKIQYWTSRGFAVLDVNYGGSTGFGREYRERLKGQWGIVDVDDCESGALYLAAHGFVDSQKMVIRGGSAGGFTTLAALAFTKTFVAGASYAGVSDLELLSKNTHKFESHYSDGLVAPYPEEVKIYRERSPYYHADQVKVPVVFFHGEKDVIVPSEQAELMHRVLKEQGIMTELNIYKEEEHGFRLRKNIVDSLEKELQFYLNVLEKM